MQKNQRGFTIIELIVVIAIIALLSGIVSTNVTKYIAKAKLTRANTEVKNIEKALLAFYSKYGQYPSNDGMLCEWGMCGIYSGHGDPCLYNEFGNIIGCLSEFYKFDWTNQYPTQYLVPHSLYYIWMENTNEDDKIDCGYIQIVDSSWMFMYGQKGVLCADADCWQCSPENQYPFRTTSWW